MTRAKYPPEVKAAVLAELLEGQAVDHVAEKYSIPKGTVKGWKSRSLNNSETLIVPTQKKIELGELLSDLLQTRVQAQIAIAKTIADPNYIKRQSASDIAVLAGVLDDKTFRMLEAFGQADDSDTDPDD